MNVALLQELLRQFVRERDWEQFHGPKNLVMALAGETGELLELFQWLTPEQSAVAMNEPRLAEKIRDELADVQTYLLRLADVLKVDLEAAVRAKVAKNAAKYPVALAKGNAVKYTDFSEP